MSEAIKAGTPSNAAWGRSDSTRRSLPWGSIGYWAASLLFIFVSIFPLLYALSSSFKQGSGLFSPALWPAAPHELGGHMP